MKINKYLAALLSLFVIVFVSCEDKSDLTVPEAPSTGSANFAKFVSIGNSLTQGEQSGSVFESAQEYSYGNLIAKQVGTTYAQALFTDPGSGGRIEVQSVSPFVTKINSQAGSPKNLTYPAPYNNLGVKGAFLWDVANTTSSANNYTAQFGAPNSMFDAVLRGSGNTQLQLAIAQNPTFVTLWIGNNDILAYATRGGLFPVTSASNFQTWYGQILDALAATNAKVVVANIPDVTSVPFFTTVGGQLLLSGVSAVAGTKADGSVGLLDLRKNLLTLQAAAELAQGKGLSAQNPLSNGVILDESEIAIAKQVINGYNQIISSLANAKGYGVVDINAFFTNVAANGLDVDGLHFTARYVEGGIFSLDGVHPTSQGYAVIANEFIKVINAKFSAKIPLVNVSTIPGSLVLAKKVEYDKLGIPIFPEGALDNIAF